MMNWHDMKLAGLAGIILFAALLFGLCLNTTTQAATDKKGMWYDDSIKKAAVEVAKARLEVAKVDERACFDELQHYKTEWNRAQQLYKRDAISHAEYNEISRRYVRFTGESLRSKARTAEAQALLRYAELTGEIDKALTNRHE